VLENKRLPRHSSLGLIQLQLKAACIFLLPDWKLPCPAILKTAS
jgi:hypothetical protein